MRVVEPENIFLDTSWRNASLDVPASMAILGAEALTVKGILEANQDAVTDAADYVLDAADDVRAPHEVVDRGQDLRRGVAVDRLLIQGDVASD